MVCFYLNNRRTDVFCKQIMKNPFQNLVSSLEDKSLVHFCISFYVYNGTF